MFKKYPNAAFLLMSTYQLLVASPSDGEVFLGGSDWCPVDIFQFLQFHHSLFQQVNGLLYSVTFLIEIFIITKL